MLRTSAGVPVGTLGPAAARIPDLVAAGLAVPPVDGRLALTPQGRLVADSIALELW